MSHVGVTVHTVEHVMSTRAGRPSDRQHGMHKILMTTDTGTLSHTAIAWFDFDGFVKVLQGECQRVKKSIVGLRHPFADEVVR